MSHAHFRLDWLREAKKLKPYFEGNPGVVRIDFESEDAAVDKFNHFVKEQFKNGHGNGQWLSLRLDDDWSTTHTIDDQIFAIARKLNEAGVGVDWDAQKVLVGDIASGNSAETGNIDISIENSVFGLDASPNGIQKRLELVCNAMMQFVASGGRFMLIVNDMKPEDQGKVWKSIWNAGLHEAGGDHISLVYYVGPKCGQGPHEDAPGPEVAFKLPHNIEADDARQQDIYDDVIDILTASVDCSEEEAIGAAGALVDSNSDSVRRLHISLSKTIMNWGARKGLEGS